MKKEIKFSMKTTIEEKKNHKNIKATIEVNNLNPMNFTKG